MAETAISFNVSMSSVLGPSLFSLYVAPIEDIIRSYLLNCAVYADDTQLYLRNKKHFPCFYRVIETRVEVWENEKCCGNTSRRRVFPQLFRVLPNLRECFYNSIETLRKCFLFLLENSLRKITKNEENLIVLFIIKT